jgi:nucleolar pre-ribosomal-associated protein 1
VSQIADLQEKPLVLHVLNLVKGLYPSALDTSSDRVPRVPSYTILLLVHALRGVFYPSNFIYPLTARFLLQRPSLDPTDIPMLFSMMYNSDDDWKKARAWIMRLLVDGMTCARDWKVFRRRHTWDLVATLFQISDDDRALRQATLDVRLLLTYYLLGYA